MSVLPNSPHLSAYSPLLSGKCAYCVVCLNPKQTDMKTQTIAAAKFYLQAQGLTGTQKQIEKLYKQLQSSDDAILRLAADRGFKN